MKSESQLPRIIALALLAVIIVLANTGCVSSRYKKAAKKTPPPQLLNVAFVPGPLEASLVSVITYNGPGSWKRNAFWDEYVVALRNPGPGPLVVSVSDLVDHAGASRLPGDKPWTLEKESKTLERKYKEAGVAFVRYTAPGVLILGAGLTVALANTGPLISFGASSAGAGAGATIAGATVIALPVYYIAVLSINHNNKVAMEKEFNQRRLALPLTLEPGETRTGSVFFPMVTNPRSLRLQWSTGPAIGASELPLDFLHGLHAPPARIKSS